MHVVLISQCEHRAIARTARVLDAYARRQGDRTWITPITREGLQTLQSILRAGATRQTAVACYVSQGMRQMRLVWVVGAKSRFGPKGEVAVATRRLRATMIKSKLAYDLHADMQLSEGTAMKQQTLVWTAVSFRVNLVSASWRSHSPAEFGGFFGGP